MIDTDAPDEPNAASDAIDADAVPPAATSATTIDAQTDQEVAALAVESIVAIGNDIAVRVATSLKPAEGDLIVVTALDVVDRIAAARTFELRMGLLEEAMEGLLQRREAVLAEGVVTDTMKATSEAVEALAGLLAHFRSETAYLGRKVVVDNRALRTVVAGALSSKGIEVLLTDVLALADPRNSGISGLYARLERLAGLASQIRIADDSGAGTQIDPVVPDDGSDASGVPQPKLKRWRNSSGDLLAAYEQLVAELSGQPGALVDLHAAGELIHMIDAAPRAYLLAPAILKTGGNYRVRKSIFTMLLADDGVSISAGAAADFVLWDLRTMRVAIADIVYHSSGNRRLPRTTRLTSLSNIGSCSTLPAAVNGSRLGAVAGEDKPTPNIGDDEAAVDRGEIPPESLEAAPGGEAAGPLPWRPAYSLTTLLRQVNRMAPRRNKASDGIVGDAAHATRDSDHNPWIVEAGKGVVTAIDITNDPRNACSAEAIAESIRASRDPRVKYIIWNRRIANSSSIDGAPPWSWRRYRGRNPHDQHVHISVKAEKTAYDSTEPWSL